jgi:hypothetical protein
LSEVGTGGEHIQATRDSNGSYVMVYVPVSKPVVVNTSVIAGSQLRVWWFDPRTGAAQLAGEYSNDGQREFTPSFKQRRKRLGAGD